MKFLNFMTFSRITDYRMQKYEIFRKNPNFFRLYPKDLRFRYGRLGITK